VFRAGRRAATAPIATGAATTGIARMAAAVAVAMTLLAGCRTLPPQPVIGPGPDAPWAEQRAGLEKLDRFGLTGRVAVAANGEGFSANLRYEQQPAGTNLALDGPMGIGGVRVAMTGGDLRIETSSGKQLDGAAAREELEQRLGFALPLAELRWWLLGIPAPGDAQVDEDAGSGEIRGFMQNGWRVSIDSRAPGLGFALPRRLTAERAAADLAGARMKLLVEQWRP
jgi:outer membrane lipoprotein LolB